MLQKTRFIVFIGLLLLAVSGCRTSKEEQAAHTVDDFFKSVQEDNFEKAKELSTEDSKPVLIKVADESKTHRKDVKPEKVEVEIINKEVEDTQALITVNIKVGSKIKKEKVKLVLVNDKWLVVVQKPQVQVIRYVVFYDQYEIVVLPKIRIIKVSLEDEHHHHGRGHAYGHRKHKHH